ELRTKAPVVLVEEPEVLDAVAEDRDAVDAEAEGEALHLLGVVADGAQHVRMDHAGAEHLEPPPPAADAAGGVHRPGRRAPEAGDVDRGGRLGEGEEARPEADAGLGSEEPAEE